MIGWLGAVFVASLLGSLHCAGMCGGFVGCLAGDRAGRGFPLHGAYHLGRLVGYLTLGGIAGLLGSGLQRSAALTGIHGIAPILCGAMIVGFAAVAGARALGWKVPLPVPTGPSRVVGRVLASLRERGPLVRGGALGLLTALLPCGWLYAFVVTAAGTGTVAGGVATLGAFWLGTVPILLGLGLGAGRLWTPLRARLPLASAGLLLALGVGTVLGHGPVDVTSRAFSPSEVAAIAPEGSVPPAAPSHPEIPREAPCCDE